MKLPQIIGVLAITLLLLAIYLVFSYAQIEKTMLEVQKIFYFHVPSWIVMFLAVFICGFSSAIYLFKERPAADRLAVASAELAVLFGLMGLMTGPLWAIKAWGVWWQWDARLTMALILELIFPRVTVASLRNSKGGSLMTSARREAPHQNRHQSDSL